MGAIVVVPLPGADAGALERLAERLEYTFHRRTEIAPVRASIDFAYDPSRDQYSSRALLAALLQERPAHAERLLGVTAHDLFVPVLTFVFGEAQLGGTAAAVSTFRLDNAFYGMEADAEVLQERLEKESIHELGHTYGLLHCPDGQCVMRSSTYVEDLDIKRIDFCTACARELAGVRA